MEKSVRKIRTRNFREFELLIWLLVLLVFFIIIFFTHRVYKDSYDLHNIFMSDVDGLIVGSPVNLMGVPVGYVTKLKIINDDEVFVRFIIKDKSIKLPKGTIANVEFSGMAGSKSIELYPPDKDYVQMYGLDANDDIIVAPAKRLHDSTKLLYQMFTKIGAIIDRISYFAYEIQDKHLDKESVSVQKDINNFLEFSNGWVNNVQKKTNNIKQQNNIKKENRSVGNE